MAHVIPQNQVPEGAIVFVSGLSAGYSYISQKLEGAALADQNERDRRMGRNPQEKPYNTLTLNEAVIVDGYGRPVPPESQDTAQRYVNETCYPSRAKHAIEKGYTGLSCNKINKGNFLPTVYRRQADGSLSQMMPLEKGQEPAQDSRLTMVIRIYKVRRNNNSTTGMSLDGVIFEEEPRFFTPGGTGNLNASLQELGITVHPLDAAQQALADQQLKDAQATQSQPAASVIPQTPAQPQAPYQPQIPAQPQAPQAPAYPVQPQAPYAQQFPGQAAQPTIQAPYQPQVPAQPQARPVPQVPTQPQMPQAPQAPAQQDPFGQRRIGESIQPTLPNTVQTPTAPQTTPRQIPTNIPTTPAPATSAPYPETPPVTAAQAPAYEPQAPASPADPASVQPNYGQAQTPGLKPPVDDDGIY